VAARTRAIWFDLGGHRRRENRRNDPKFGHKQRRTTNNSGKISADKLVVNNVPSTGTHDSAGARS
jgi:hypothetical protein